MVVENALGPCFDILPINLRTVALKNKCKAENIKWKMNKMKKKIDSYSLSYA